MLTKKVIIIGSDAIAMSIAETLCNEPNIHLYIIESNEDDFYRTQDSLDAVFILGDEADPEVLKQANVEDADILITLNRENSVNITVSLLAKYFNPKIKVISAIDTLHSNYELLSKDKLVDVDLFINPEELTSEKINNLLKNTKIIEYTPILHNKFVILGFEVTNEMSITNKNLIELTKMNPDISMLIVGINRDKEFIMPEGKTVIKSKDLIYFLVLHKHIKRSLEFFLIETKKVEKILIVGGGRYSTSVIKKIANRGYDITIIDRSQKAIDKLKEKYPKLNYIVKDIKDMNLNDSRELFATDLYMALTNNDQVNLITSVYAKQNTDAVVVSLNFDNKHFKDFDRFNIKHIINPKSLISNKLSLYLNEGNILSMVTIFNEDAVIIELVPSKNSILINRKLKDITEFPPHTLIGVIEHNNHPFIPHGESIIHKNDKLLIFVKKSYLDNVLKLFK